MHRTSAARLAHILASAVLGLSVAPAAWNPDYDSAMADAMKRQLPVLVLFDGPATSAKRQNLIGGLLRDAAFTDFAARQLILCRVCAPGDSNDAAHERSARQLRANFGVDSLPALVLLDPDARTLGTPRLRANQPSSEIVDEIRELIPESLRPASLTNAPPAAARGPLTVRLDSPTNPPTTATTIDLRALRRQPAPPAHPSLIVLPPHAHTQTNAPSHKRH